MVERNERKRSDSTDSISQHEDAVLKTAMLFFSDELLPYFGIEGKVVSIAPTELVHLDVKKIFQDFNLVMDDGAWKHFDFQSTNEGIEGLKRFRVYEAGFDSTDTLSSDGGEMSLKDRVITAFGVMQKAAAVDPEDIRKVEAVLYVMADKFLDSMSMEEVMEGIRMTKLGQMLVDKGKEEGREVGREEGAAQEKIEIARNLIGLLDEQVIAERTGLTLETVQQLKKEKNCR